MDFGMPCQTLPPPFHCPLVPPPPDSQGAGSFWTLLLPAPVSHSSETMELWRQLRQVGLLPPGLGLPPRALRDVPPSGRAGQTLVFPQAHTEGTRESLLWIWEELGNLRRLDVQLLGQLCSLGLEMGVLREELVTFLEEENEETLKEEEEDEDPEGKQEEGHLGDSCPAAGYRLPDFEMTI
ncbi:glutamate-rich protein 4 isoform X1 [Desmodus rotundus]|uniref:glutamate-rich protein 4 isoform X1 n=1 Tax=Desmodus rotundus TaxID=9430 RepID=UPI000D1807E3|nr:glutamate-rich protein 4 isoform X1 [Desmodus rotundus]